MTKESGPRGRTAAALAAAGGSLAAIGSVYDWASVTGRRGGIPATGADLFGPFTVGAGLAAVIAGLLLLGAGGRARIGLAALILAGGVVAAGLGIYVATSERVVIDALSEGRDSPKPPRRAKVSAEPGLYVVIGGGMLAVAGGVAGLLSARERRSPETAAAGAIESPAVRDEEIRE